MTLLDLFDSHRAPDTPAPEALALYCKAVALKRDGLAKAACEGIIKTKFSQLPEDLLKSLPSEAIIALVSLARQISVRFSYCTVHLLTGQKLC